MFAVLVGVTLALRCELARELDQRTARCGDMDIREATVAEVHRHMHRRRLTCVQLVECYLDRIHRLNPFLRAVIQLNPRAREVAAALDARHTREKRIVQALHCVPVLVKDNIGTADDMETSAGAYALVGIRPTEDNLAVARIRRSGAVILGKSNLSELSG